MPEDYCGTDADAMLLVQGNPPRCPPNRRGRQAQALPLRAKVRRQSGQIDQLVEIPISGTNATNNTVTASISRLGLYVVVIDLR